jgi:hypothetical protein
MVKRFFRKWVMTIEYNFLDWRLRVICGDGDGDGDGYDFSRGLDVVSC